MKTKESGAGWAVWIVVLVIGGAFAIARSSNNNSSAVSTPEPAAAAVAPAEQPRETTIEERVAGLTAGEKLIEVRRLAKEGLTKSRAGTTGADEAYQQAERILATIPNDVAEGPEARQWEREVSARRQLFGRAPTAQPQQPSIASPSEPNTTAPHTASTSPPTWTAPSDPVPAPIAANGPCAENGSCYGDISPETGRPKQVHVQGYYRKDGTYVRGHYRSAPRR